jgi:hypothetical protein
MLYGNLPIAGPALTVVLTFMIVTSFQFRDVLLACEWIDCNTSCTQALDIFTVMARAFYSALNVGLDLHDFDFVSGAR